MTDHEAYIAFNLVPDIGSVKVGELVKKHGGVVAAWEALPEKKDWRGLPVEWRAELERAERMHVTIITCEDPRYPAALNDLASKPLALYVVGDPAALSKPGVAVVGTRHPTLYGTDMAERFAMGIVRGGMSVISGLATGIDAEAHKGALKAGGVTVGLLGGALDRFFPDENRDLGHRIVAAGGAVASEYPFGFPPGKKTFPQRNRIVAAMSRGVLAVEAPIPSGTLITCSFAKELGRKVMAIPANLDSRNSAGCWKLIREGAAMVMSPGEVVALCGGDAGVHGGQSMPSAKSSSSSPAAVAKPKPQLTLEESSVLRAIPSTGITLDRLAFNVKLPATKVGDVTMSLRLKHLIRFLPGNRVAPAKD
jgi:DNA processing protein